MPKISAGILLFRIKDNSYQFLLVHPGGPFFKKRQEGFWTIPKGEPSNGEELFTAAIREFREETGHEPPAKGIELKPVRQKGGKEVHAWAIEDDLDADSIVSNTFHIEWPPASGKWQSFPEIDAARWCTFEEALALINPAQQGLLFELVEKLRLL